MDRWISQSSPISEIYIQWKILCQKKKKRWTPKSHIIEWKGDWREWEEEREGENCGYVK